MALTDYIGIRGAIEEEPFQGIGAGTITVSATSSSDSSSDSTQDYTLDDGWGLDAPATQEDWPELFKRAFFYQDGENLVSILKKAWLFNDPQSNTVKSILEKALLYVKNKDGKEFIESVLNDRLSDLAFVDAVLDFGFMRVHIKGRMIEYAK